VLAGNTLLRSPVEVIPSADHGAEAVRTIKSTAPRDGTASLHDMPAGHVEKASYPVAEPT
jgi:hypothetical protein